MIRNEKGQFMSNEEKEEKREAVVKDYDAEIAEAEAKLAELRKAKEAKAEEERKATALAKKTEANVVNEAIDKYEEAKLVYKEEVDEAYKECKVKLRCSDEKFKAIEKDADMKLAEFLKKHPEGFHYTFRSKDGKVVRDYDYTTKKYDIFDFMDSFDSIWKRFLRQI